MAGVSDRPFRQLCQRLGADLAVAEMVSADPRLWHSTKTRRRLDHAGEAAPRIVQIVGHDPALLAAAARYNVAAGAEIIDINMGCPAKKVCNVLAGAALLRDEALVARILTAVVAAVPVPVTLKMRTGWDPTRRNGVRIAQLAEQAGIQALAVHGRTRACGFQGTAEYDTLRAIKQSVQIPVFANGDITSPERARAVLDYTGADGLMIGRAAQGRPWIFRDIRAYLTDGRRPVPLAPAAIGDLVLEHLDQLYRFYGEYTGVRLARKHLSWYSRDNVAGAAFRRRVNAVETAREQWALTRAFFEHFETTREVLAA
jgi:tRNA-dihydrouridine synthase B